MVFDTLYLAYSKDVERNNWVVASLFLVLSFGLLSLAVYNIYLHPLSRFPGPKIAAATPIPFAWRLVNGRMVHWTTSLHRTYGGVVRVHPNELSFIDPEAWQDIFGHARRPEFQKADVGTISWPNGVRPLPTTIDSKDHTRQKRVFENAFTVKALKDQEYMLQEHSDLLIKCLARQIELSGFPSAEVDICSWFYFTTFDMSGDLCFSEAFRSLEKAETHVWLTRVFRGVRFGRKLGALDHFQPLGNLMSWAVSHMIKGSLRKNFDWVVEKIDSRIVRKPDRPDFLRYVLNSNDAGNISRDEMLSTTFLLLTAGSGESTVAAMTALIYFALKTPGVMDKLQHEIRAAFDDKPESINLAAIAKLEYLDAALREAMRLHAPVPSSVPRIVDRPGVQICGIDIPQGTRVGISQKTAYRHSRNFVEPESFLPERWLPDPTNRFAGDQKKIFEPFMVGPRRCIAKNLAIAQMKLILTKFLWHFDLELSERNRGDWCDQRSFLVNEKKPLFVKLRARSKGSENATSAH